MRTLLFLSAAIALGCSSEAGEGAAVPDAGDATATDATDATESDATESDATDASGADVTDAASDAPAPLPKDVYVGLGSGDVVQYGFDVDAGTLSEKSRVAAGALPSFLAIAPNRRFLYAVNEASDEIAAFAIDAETGALAFLNRVSSGGAGPAFVAVDATSRWVLVANYGGGNVSVLRVEADGRLGAKVSGDAPGPKAHSFRVDATNRHAYVPTLGKDLVAQYAFDDATGALSPLSPDAVALAKGSGPRHLAFHPSGAFVFVVDELDDTVVSLTVDPKSGALSPQQTVSTLPAGFDGAKNTGADVHVAPSGKFLYASNRGHDSIAVFAIDDAGKLAPKGHTPTEGKTPRNFAIDETGRVLLVANQQSSNVVTFRIDPATGALTKLATTDVGAAAYFVGQ